MTAEISWSRGLFGEIQRDPPRHDDHQPHHEARTARTVRQSLGELLERRRAFLVLGVQLRDGLNGFFDVSREDRGSVGFAHVSS
jgi:hypothetical protein